VGDTDVGQVGGHTPADAELVAGVSNNVIRKDGVDFIVGVEFHDKDTDLPYVSSSERNGVVTHTSDKKEVVGAIIGPIPCPPNVYAKSPNNITAAKSERLDKKARPYAGTKEDKKLLGKLVSHSISDDRAHGIWTKKKIHDWLDTHVGDGFENIKSKKWSGPRLEASYQNLLRDFYPEFKLSTDVKYEPMQKGKAPRMLIADGDSGQLMGLITIKVFEDILFDHMKSKSIKHATKYDAIDRILSDQSNGDAGLRGLKHKSAKLVEGDGSAWDTTCNAQVRDLCENPVLLHIMTTILEHTEAFAPASWHRAHYKECTRETLKAFFKNKYAQMKVHLPAIRRSGHRGTSCLNWWVNYCMWLCALFQEPEKFLDPTVRKGLDKAGNIRWWNGAFEGDDSLCAIMPALLPDSEMGKLFIEFWDRAGFNMKLVFPKTRATFVGVHIVCEDGVPTPFYCPELPRFLKGAGISVSTVARGVYTSANSEADLRQVASSAFMSRAYDFAGRLPSVSNKCYEYANDLATKDRPCTIEYVQHRFGETCPVTVDNVRTHIETANAHVSQAEEQANLSKLGFDATTEELDAFRAYPWVWQEWDVDAYNASLPATWRAALE